MKWGVALNVKDKLSDTVRKAVVADRGGIDQVWVTDYPAVRYAPAVAAAIAEKTTLCRIGVGLVSPLLYSATQIVQFMATLADSYGQRFDLLLGSGDRHALDRVGVSHSAKLMVDKTKSALVEIKDELSEIGHRISIFLGAQGPRMVKASSKADGVLLNYSDLEMIEWALGLVKSKVPKEFQLGIFPPTFVGECQDIESNLSISLSATMVAIGLNDGVSESFGLRDKIETARNLMKKRGKIDLEIVKSLGEEIVRRFCFCGTIEQLRDYVKALERLGISSVVFGPPQGIRKDGVELLAKAKSGL
ncbi:MAG: LLM class flavin-dependent oxidoreductase [Candidatus Sifarchaeia archaeon]